MDWDIKWEATQAHKMTEMTMVQTGLVGRALELGSKWQPAGSPPGWLKHPLLFTKSMGTVCKVGRPWTACGREQMLLVTLALEAAAASEMRTQNIPRWGWTNCSLEKMSKDKRPMHRLDGSPQPHFMTLSKLLPLTWENEGKGKHVRGLLSRNEIWSVNRPTEFPREQDLRLNIAFN